jgi:hypothetical protein
MSAREQDFEVFSGNDKILAVTIVDEDGVAVNLGGVQEIIWAIGKTASGTAKFTKSMTSSEIEVVDAAGGRVDVIIDAEDLEPLSGDHYHEMRITDALGKKTTVMYGAVVVMTNLIRN